MTLISSAFGHLRAAPVSVSGAASPLVAPPSDGSIRPVVGTAVGSAVVVDDDVDDGAGVAGEPREGPAVSGGTVRVGEAEPPVDSLGVAVGDGSDGVGVGVGTGPGPGVVRPLVGGGASGGAGVGGPSGLARYSGTAMSAATAQVTPAPAAVRSRRRRDALRRIAS